MSQTNDYRCCSYVQKSSGWIWEARRGCVVLHDFVLFRRFLWSYLSWEVRKGKSVRRGKVGGETAVMQLARRKERISGVYSMQRSGCEVGSLSSPRAPRSFLRHLRSSGDLVQWYWDQLTNGTITQHTRSRSVMLSLKDEDRLSLHAHQKRIQTWSWYVHSETKENKHGWRRLAAVITL